MMYIIWIWLFLFAASFLQAHLGRSPNSFAENLARAFGQATVIVIVFALLTWVWSLMGGGEMGPGPTPQGMD